MAKGGSKSIENLLRYIQSSTDNNVVDENTKELSGYVREVKSGEAFKEAFMTIGDHLDREREEGRIEGREEERKNTERERLRAEKAEAEKEKAEAEKEKAEAEKKKAEAEKKKAEAEKKKAEAEIKALKEKLARLEARMR